MVLCRKQLTVGVPGETTQMYPRTLPGLLITSEYNSMSPTLNPIVPLCIKYVRTIIQLLRLAIALSFTACFRGVWQFFVTIFKKHSTQKIEFLNSSEAISAEQLSAHISYCLIVTKPFKKASMRLD